MKMKPFQIPLNKTSKYSFLSEITFKIKILWQSQTTKQTLIYVAFQEIQLEMKLFHASL